MKRSELLRLIAAQAQVSVKDAGAVLDALTGLMEAAIKAQGSFDFPEIGPIAPAVASPEISLAGLATSHGSAPKPLADLVSGYVATPASPLGGGWGGAVGGDPGIFQRSLSVPLGGLTGQSDDVAAKSLKSGEKGIRITPEIKKPIL